MRNHKEGNSGKHNNNWSLHEYREQWESLIRQGSRRKTLQSMLFLAAIMEGRMYTAIFPPRIAATAGNDQPFRGGKEALSATFPCSSANEIWPWSRYYWRHAESEAKETVTMTAGPESAAPLVKGIRPGPGTDLPACLYRNKFEFACWASSPYHPDRIRFQSLRLLICFGRHSADRLKVPDG